MSERNLDGSGPWFETKKNTYNWRPSKRGPNYRKAFVLFDPNEKAVGIVEQFNGFFLAFLPLKAPNYKGAIKFAFDDTQLFGLLGAYPTLQTAGNAVQYEVGHMLKHGKHLGMVTE